jgi:ribosome-binding factor A
MSKRFGSGPGLSQRQLRVGELIRRALSDLLARGDLHSAELAGMSITVGEVRCSPDLKIADVFVMPLGGKGAEGVTKALAAAKGEIRREVARAVKLKFAPDFRFHLDETFDQMDETRRLLSDEAVRRDLDD